jgi:plasmid stabilization system protein ParE
LPLAKQDIKEAAHWYNDKQVGLGKRFTNHIRLKLNSLKKNPRIAANRYNEVRTAVLDIFPFMTHYIIDQGKKLIIVLAVLHTSLNPNIWKKDR